MRAWTLIATVAVLYGCGMRMLATPAKPWPPLPDGHFMHVGEFLQVSGTGRAEGPTSETEGRSLARDAAILDAQARLVAYLHGLRLPNGASVGERVASDPAFSATVSGLARSASVIETKFDSEDAAVVLLRLSKVEVNDTFQTRYP